MLSLGIVFSVFAVSSAIVCTPELCQNMKQAPLTCKGSLIPKGGFCGCTDACAKVEGESCQATFMFGMIPAGTCDNGLVCQRHENHMRLGLGVCVKATDVKTEQKSVSSRSTSHHTACQQQRMARLISMVVWQGMWIPKCDPIDGSFLPQQCDNIHQCFCVDTLTGKVDESTKRLGQVDCSQSQQAIDVSGTNKIREVNDMQVMETTTHKQTKCEQIRAVRMISFVIWQGMWTPKCDVLGKFEPEQCDNTGHCFCVSADEGIVDQSTKVLGSANCAYKY